MPHARQDIDKYVCMTHQTSSLLGSLLEAQEHWCPQPTCSFSVADICKMQKGLLSSSMTFTFIRLAFLHLLPHTHYRHNVLQSGRYNIVWLRPGAPTWGRSSYSSCIKYIILPCGCQFWILYSFHQWDVLYCVSCELTVRGVMTSRGEAPRYS